MIELQCTHAMWSNTVKTAKWYKPSLVLQLPIANTMRKTYGVNKKLDITFRRMRMSYMHTYKHTYAEREREREGRESRD